MGSLRSRLAVIVSGRSRRRKIQILADLIPEGSHVLLVGVSSTGGVETANMIERAVAARSSTVALCYDHPSDPSFWGLPIVRADARHLPFRDGVFDFVVSNAVIEHLGGISGARALLDESRRVARRGFLHTTPYRWFPVETHTLIPLLHWLPRRFQAATFRLVGKDFRPERYWLFGSRGLRRLTDKDVAVRHSGWTTLVARWPPGTRSAWSDRQHSGSRQRG